MNHRSNPAEACVQQEENPVVCQFACEHDCTLVGHAYESIRFLVQCLEHNIVKSAVEEDPNYLKLNIEIAKMQFLLLKRIK